MAALLCLSLPAQVGAFTSAPELGSDGGYQEARTQLNSEAAAFMVRQAVKQALSMYFTRQLSFDDWLCFPSKQCDLGHHI